MNGARTRPNSPRRLNQLFDVLREALSCNRRGTKTVVVRTGPDKPVAAIDQAQRPQIPQDFLPSAIAKTRDENLTVEP